MKALKFLGVAILACSMLFVSCKKDQNYTITTKVNDAVMGTVTGGGSYAANATATLVATANPGYAFVQWQDGNKDATRKITVTKNETYTATFQAQPGTKITFNGSAWTAANVAAVDFSSENYMTYYIYKTQSSQEDVYLLGFLAFTPGTYTYESSEGDYMKYTDPNSIYTADEAGAAIIGCEVGAQYYMYGAVKETFTETVTAVDLNAQTTTAVFAEDIFNMNAVIAAGGTSYGETQPLNGNMSAAPWTLMETKANNAKHATPRFERVK